MTIVWANRGHLCVETFGDLNKPALLLISGAGDSMLQWDDVFCARLAASSRFVIRYDHRGDPQHTIRDLATDAAGLLDIFGLPRVHVVGISMGGAIAQLMALNHPGKIATLTLVATGPESTDHGAGDVEHAPGIRSMVNHFIRDGEGRWRGRLGQVTAPTLVIHGTEDAVFPYAHGVALAGEIPGAELLTLEQTGHELPKEVWDVVIPAIVRHTA